MDLLNRFGSLRVRISGLIVGLSIAALGIGFSYWKIKQHYDTALAEQITSEANTLKQNQKAFIALGILNAPIHVGRSTDSDGRTWRANSAAYFLAEAAAKMNCNNF